MIYTLVEVWTAEKKKEYMREWRKKNREKIQEYNRRYREDNPEYWKNRNKTYYHANKEDYFRRAKEWKQKTQEWYLEQKSKPCADCGNTFPPRVMAFHHEGNKEHGIAWMVGKGFAIKRIEAEMEKCILLCANCHLLRHC